MFLSTHGIVSSSSEVVIPYSNTKSIELDGVSDYITMGNVLAFNKDNAFTFSLWINMQQSETSSILSKSESSNNFAGYLLYTTSSGGGNKLLFRIRTNASNFILFTSTSVFNLNEWYHVSITYDGLGANTGINMYVNGVNQAGARTGTSSSAFTNNQPFNLGARNLNSLFFNGLIDEVAVFNSELSSSDVTSIYNSGNPPDLSSHSNLVSWWRMGDNDTYPTISDNIGSNDGTMNGMTSASIVSDTP
jgi:hypothetical protein